MQDTAAQNLQLIADIGATNARFQLLEQFKPVGAPITLPTKEFSQAPDLVRSALAALDADSVDQALFALAGPHDAHGNITLSNTGLQFAQQNLSSQLDAPLWLVNDFYALAHGVPHFKALHQLGGNSTPGGINKALLGPGSGLGMAILVPDRGKASWRVVASEGGHADLAPANHLDAQLWEILSLTHQHVSWETVVCGPGLLNLYRAMCQIWGAAPEPLTPEEISQRGVTMQDPVCHQTLESFCGLLGSAAGNLALTATATDGVYIAGGIVGHFVDFLETTPLRRRFEERGAMTDLIQDVPIFVVTEPHPGLLGAAHCLSAQIIEEQR